MNLNSFVAFDFETTGTDPRQDRIIEVGAVRFEGGSVTGTFSALVDPGCPIPSRIRRLTGIGDGDVAGQPGIHEILPNFVEFCGGLPLIAHNAPFDLGFLENNFPTRFLPNRLALDTLELARVVLPLHRSYSLADLSRSLGIALERSHRAREDALATGQVFLELRSRVFDLNFALLQEILRLGEPSDWPLQTLFQEAFNSLISRFPDRKITSWLVPPETREWREPQTDSDASRMTDLDPDELGALLGPGGPLASCLGGYEHRPQQVEMMTRVARAFNEGCHLLMEAGTGTGKSLAYLVPSVEWGRRNREKVVVSTHTINLQEQLWEKDIPFLKKSLPLDFEAALIKGRSNYLCLRRREEAATGADFFLTPEERAFHIRVASWLSHTTTGDKSELNLRGPEEENWSQVMSESEACLGQKCPYNQKRCFFFRSRRRAQAAQVLVVNHSLLLSDLKTENKVLPSYRHLVIDEAHHLEDVATKHLGLEVGQGAILGTLSGLFRGHREGRPGFLNLIKSRFGESVDRRVEAIIDIVIGAREAANELFSAVGEVVTRAGRTGEEGGTFTLRLTDEIRSGPLWDAVDTARSNAGGRLRALAGGLADLGTTLEESQPFFVRNLESILADLGKYTSLCQEFARGIDFVLLAEAEDWVHWVEHTRRPEWTRGILRAAPVEVGPLLSEQLFGPVRSVILTSATLSVHGSFQHLKERLGLNLLPPDRVMSGAVTSPFEYRKQALLCIPDDLPNPREAGEEGFVTAMEPFLVDILTATRGRALVLFTSHKMLRQVYFRLREPLEERGLYLLAQGLDGSRSRLVEEFKTREGSVLFGSASFWEGVDIPGEELSCVVMVRLPFAPPTAPVTEARIENLQRRGLSAFHHLSLPQAVIRFKQGFGRLIRSKRDRGVVVVFDSRISADRSNYGIKFLRSLPSPACVVGSRGRIIDEIARWLAEPQRDDLPGADRGTIPIEPTSAEEPK